MIEGRKYIHDRNGFTLWEKDGKYGITCVSGMTFLYYKFDDAEIVYHLLIEGFELAVMEDI
jgi:hypothetical protein